MAAGGRFSKAAVKLHGYVGMNPDRQLVAELNTMHMTYTDTNSLALQMPKRQLALNKSTFERQLVWEMLRVLDKVQHKERDADMARALCEMHDEALCFFTTNPRKGAAIYKHNAGGDQPGGSVCHANCHRYQRCGRQR